MVSGIVNLASHSGFTHPDVTHPDINSPDSSSPDIRALNRRALEKGSSDSGRPQPQAGQRWQRGSTGPAHSYGACDADPIAAAPCQPIDPSNPAMQQRTGSPFIAGSPLIVIEERTMIDLEPAVLPPDARQEHPRAADTTVAGASAGLTKVIPVPLMKVRFLQAMAEDGPGARHSRIGGHPSQRVVQDNTLC